MARRDEWLRWAAGAARPGDASPAGDARRGGVWRRRGMAVLVGWLVLMTVWGVGRSGFAQRVDWFLGVGLLAGVVTAAVLWRRPGDG